MDIHVRRAHLATNANPNPRIDYVVTLSGNIGNQQAVDVLYIPDTAVLAPDSLAMYLSALASLHWGGLEPIAATIVSDINNELIPRWVQVTVSGTSAGLAHRVTIEDRQPRWDNPVLLSRISSI